MHIDVPDKYGDSLRETMAYVEGYNRAIDEKLYERSLMTPNERVLTAILRTKIHLGDYWEKTLKGRLENGGSGSRFLSDDIVDVEEQLISAGWEPYPAVQHLLLEGCTAFRAEIPGKMGVVEIESLPECADIFLVDRKKTGFLSAEVASMFAKRSTPVDHTVIILGQEAGHEVVFTVHPGDPVKPSQLKGYPRTIHRDEAIALGLKYAKVVDGK